MRSEGLAIGVVLAIAAYPGLAQTESIPRVGGWQSQGGSSTVSESHLAPKSSGPAPLSAGKLAPIPNARRGPKAQVPKVTVAKVTKGTGTLPNEHGQVWREYDISPYTLSVTSTDRPEQAIVDWILRETGYEAWHSDVVSLLSASPRKLRVYHTPATQEIVAGIVDRFVDRHAESYAFGMRIVTIENPNWRSAALRLLKPVPVQSQGVQGWLLAKEDAALLLSELQRRSDSRERSSPHLIVHNGQSTVVSSIRPRNYIRGVMLRNDIWPGFEHEMGMIEEGYSLEFSPLLSKDGQTVDAVIKLRLNQVEKMLPVVLEVPSTVAQRQRTRIDVPQMTMCHLHERFRWPVNQVLLLSTGVVASPGPARSNPIANALALPQSPPRADALLFLECRPGAATQPPASTAGNEFARRY